MSSSNKPCIDVERALSLAFVETSLESHRSMKGIHDRARSLSKLFNAFASDTGDFFFDFPSKFYCSRFKNCPMSLRF